MFDERDDPFAEAMRITEDCGLGFQMGILEANSGKGGAPYPRRWRATFTPRLECGVDTDPLKAVRKAIAELRKERILK